ncbi:NAD(P)-dependent oxidoreductase [Haematococcus lacustris]|uniref:NAD(P)-dependent oxidoreductase n=1 Tax=Haematococcus lacustris TaxID=44745 RepID=A0A699Z1D1_HAELA|nr:NAD(P)-dependent oxidoreductase [Haematococcus lacustris]
MYGQLDVLINNAAEQHYRHSIADITDEQLERTFATNIFGMFYMTKAALPHLKPGSSIVNTTSVTSYQGQPELLDYSSTKGCITAFTRSLSQQLADKGKHLLPADDQLLLPPGQPGGIRVNAVAPGPIWTPLIPATFPKMTLAKWQTSAPLGAGQPSEVATCFVFLASEDGSYYTGQVLHPNGGMPVNS